MGENSRIEWCDHTFNPWEGCVHVSPGCEHCYAEARDRRFGGGAHWGPRGERRRTSPAAWRKPLAWNRAAASEGVRRRVFCASLADVFELRPELTPWRWDLWRLIESTPWVDWLLLTKRPQNVLGMVPPGWLWTGKWPFHVWMGTTVEDQRRADERIPQLLELPARVRFLSCEPLLERVNISQIPVDDAGDHALLFPLAGEFTCEGRNEPLPMRQGRISWVIAGGESGPRARPMHPDWARSLRDQCAAAGVPFFFKQWGEWIGAGQVVERPWEDTRLHRWPDGAISSRAPSKHAAGREIDGRTWDELPEL